MLLTAKLVIFLCSVISQGKVVALDRWGGKRNHLLMTHRLSTNYAKNYCNRTRIVEVIVENVVTCFFGTRCIVRRVRWKTVVFHSPGPAAANPLSSKAQYPHHNLQRMFSTSWNV